MAPWFEDDGFKPGHVLEETKIELSRHCCVNWGRSVRCSVTTFWSSQTTCRALRDEEEVEELCDVCDEAASAEKTDDGEDEAEEETSDGAYVCCD